MLNQPVNLVEESVTLLRRQPVTFWLQYLTSAVPLLLALVWFFHDMSAGYFAYRCAPEAFVCALAFLWSSVWRARFSQTLSLSLNEAPDDTASSFRFGSALYLQAIVQSMKLIALPLAIVSVVPSVWASGFFRSAALEASQPSATLGSVLGKSRYRASSHMRSNWLSMFVIGIVYCLVLANVFVVVVGLPWVVRTITGSESQWTRHFQSLFSFNAFCFVLALTWLIVDPLLQAYAIVRAFYIDARKDGRDLLAKLRVAASFGLLVTALCGCLSAAPAVSPMQLEKAVDQAAQSDDYGWLRVHEDNRHYGPAEAFLKRLNDDLSAFGRQLQRLLSGFGKWLRKALRSTPAKGEPAPIKAAGKDVRLLIYFLCALVLLAAGYLLIRNRRKRGPETAAGSITAAPPNLSSETIFAADLPEDEWLRIAQDLLAKGEPRLALRALYLSNLAYLGSLHLIRLGRSKTNAIYERELRQRPGMRDACLPFSESNRQFERVWYGFHEVTPTSIDVFRRDVEAIRLHAKA